MFSVVCILSNENLSNNLSEHYHEIVFSTNNHNIAIIPSGLDLTSVFF